MLAPKWTEFPRYPVIAGIALLATGVTVADWAKVDVTPLVENAMVRRGELWRLLTSIFPHVGALHLIFNIYWLWLFGAQLEQIYGHLKTAALVLLFAAIPNALEYAFASGGVGLSGVVYGFFGLLWVLSKRDERFRDAIDKRTIQLFVGWFFFCIFLTLTDYMRIGNIAHGSGAVLGILTGYAITQPERRATVAAGIGIIFAVALWAATLGRPRVNVSAYASYDECKQGYDAMQSNHNDEALSWLQAAASYQSNPAGCVTQLGFVYQRLGRDTQAFAEYRKAAGMGNADGQYFLATMYENGKGGTPKNAREATDWYRKAGDKASADPVNADVLNNVAWAFATSPDPEIRNPKPALDYALRAVNADKDRPRAHVLDTLAEAYYANGKYEDAVKTEQKALGLLPAAQQSTYLKQLEKYNLALSESKQPESTK